MISQELSQLHATVRYACDSNPTQWIPAIAGILGAFVGATASLFPNLFIESSRRKHEALLVEASLISEMTAIVEIADERRYLASLEEVIQYLEIQPDGTTVVFSASVPPHYSRVYQANAHRIGIIEKSKATDIIRFHQLVDAVVQDVIEGGVLNRGGTLQAFRENHQILSRAFEICRKYTGAPN